MSDVLGKQPLTFNIDPSMLEDRLDPLYYHPEYLKAIEKLKASFHKIVDFNSIIETLYRDPFFYGISTLHTGIPLLRGENIIDDELVLDLDNTLYISEENYRKFIKSSVKPGDIVFSVRGTVGKVTVIPRELSKASISPNLIKIRLIKNINPYYVHAYLQSEYGKLQIEHCTYGTVQTTITAPAIKSIKIPVPPKVIQDKVAKIMQKAYKERRIKLSRAEKLLDSINDIILKELGIELPEIEEKKIFRVEPENLEDRLDAEYYQPKYSDVLKTLKKGSFKTSRLRDLCNTINNGSTPAKEQYTDTGIAILKVANLTKEGIDWDNVSYVPEDFYRKSTKAHVKTNDILLLSSAHQTGYLGKKVEIIGKIPNKLDGKVMAVGELIIIRADENKINPFYLLSYLKLPHAGLLMRRCVRGQSAHLYPKDIALLEIPTPPLEIQDTIAEKAIRIREEAWRLKREAQEAVENAKGRGERIILKGEDISWTSVMQLK